MVYDNKVCYQISWKRTWIRQGDGSWDAGKYDLTDSKQTSVLLPQDREVAFFGEAYVENKKKLEPIVQNPIPKGNWGP